MIELLNMDCMEFLKNVPDKYYNLSICDPPYGLQSGKSIYNGGGLHTKSSVKFGSKFNMMDSCNNKKWDTEIPTQKYFDELYRVSENWIIWGANYFSLPPSRGFIVWDKMQTVDNFSACELAYTSFNMPSKIFKNRNHGIFRDSKSIHPTQKSIFLYEYLLLNYAKQGDKILDTHLGSGSIAIACHKLGFSLTGIELDKDYFNAAKERLEIYQQQETLF